MFVILSVLFSRDKKRIKPVASEPNTQQNFENTAKFFFITFMSASAVHTWFRAGLCPTYIDLMMLCNTG